MKDAFKHLFLIAQFLFPFCLQMNADNFSVFHPDSIPSSIQKLDKYYEIPNEYLKQWNKLKAEADATGNLRDNYFLLKDINYFYYMAGETDSVRKYTTILQDLSRKYNDEHGYYYNWILLSETYSNLGDGKAARRENEAIYNDALHNKSDIGMAYNLYAIASGYLTAREYKKAEPYLVQAMEKFYQMKRWDIYVVLAANNVILLSEQHREEESVAAFHKLDSLADCALASKLPGLSPRNIAMIKYQALVKSMCSEDMETCRKYLKDIETIYQKYPSIPKIYLYGSKQVYAYLNKDYVTQAAYIDSSVNYYRARNSKENMRRMYQNEGQALALANRYEEAYDKLLKVIKLSDTLSWDKTNKQVNYLSAKYNTKKLELEKRELILKTRNMQLILSLSIGITLLLGLSSLMIFYRHKSKLNYKLHLQDKNLIAANEKIQKANEMKAVFIQNMNHEIRTPLNAIVGFSNIISDSSLTQEELKEISKTIKTNSDNLLKIISDMLSIANLESDGEEPHSVPFSVNECCEELINNARIFVNENTNLYSRLPDEDFTLVSDRKMIYKIIFNLLHNATKFTLKGNIELSYRIDASSKRILFLVRDTGIGIPKEKKEIIFERFYKVDSFTQGSGLGLSLCKIYAHRLKGEVYLDDSYQGGSLFVLMLPIS